MNFNNKKQSMNFFDTSDKLEGFEDINQSTMAIPFIKLAQELSPEINQSRPNYISGLKSGQFFNSISKTVYGNTMQVIVGRFDRIFIEWLPNRGGFVSYHSPEQAEKIATDLTFGKWKHGDNDLSEFYMYYILVIDYEFEGVMIASLFSTQIRKAKSWNRMLTTYKLPNGSRALPYYMIWDIKSVREQNNLNSWWGWDIKFNKLVNEKQYNQIKNERLRLSDRNIYTRSLDYNQLSNPKDDGAEF